MRIRKLEARKELMDHLNDQVRMEALIPAIDHEIKFPNTKYSIFVSCRNSTEVLSGGFFARHKETYLYAYWCGACKRQFESNSSETFEYKETDSSQGWDNSWKRREVVHYGCPVCGIKADINLQSHPQAIALEPAPFDGSDGFGLAWTILEYGFAFKAKRVYCKNHKFKLKYSYKTNRAYYFKQNKLKPYDTNSVTSEIRRGNHHEWYKGFIARIAKLKAIDHMQTYKDVHKEVFGVHMSDQLEYGHKHALLIQMLNNTEWAGLGLQVIRKMPQSHYRKMKRFANFKQKREFVYQTSSRAVQMAITCTDHLAMSLALKERGFMPDQIVAVLKSNKLNYELKHLHWLSHDANSHNGKLLDFALLVSGGDRALTVHRLTNQDRVMDGYDCARMYEQIKAFMPAYPIPSMRGGWRAMHDRLTRDHGRLVRNPNLVIEYKAHELKLEEEIEGYKFVLPKETIEVFDCGQQMGHCVGAYSMSVAKGEIRIVFVKGPDGHYENCIGLYPSRYEEGKYTLNQAKCLANQKPTGELLKAIWKWVANHGINDNSLDLNDDIHDMQYREERMTEQRAMRDRYLEALKDAPKVEALVVNEENMNIIREMEF